MILKQQIRSLPYYNVHNIGWEYELMRMLRGELIPKIKQRMPWHHLSAFQGGFIPEYIRKHKKQYSFFVRTDIRRFYPSVRHTDLLLYAQLAYRDLLSLPFVPKTFRQQYVPQIQLWIDRLPLAGYGLPVGSPMSALLAPLALVPLWLELKARFDIRPLIVADDILILCKNAEDCADVYTFLHNRLLNDYRLELQPSKTSSGRFSEKELTYCGWSFKGGYARISGEKVNAFKERLTCELKACTGKPLQAMIKRINRKIDGFGHYYKFGQVGKQFGELDVFVRSCLRASIREKEGIALSNDALARSIGLRSLSDIYSRASKKGIKLRKLPPPVRMPNRDSHPASLSIRQILLLEKIMDSLLRMENAQKRQNKLMGDLIQQLSY